jgi:hypothetical protein
MNFFIGALIMTMRSKMSWGSVVIRSISLCLAIGCCTTAHASLGGDSTSVEADRVHMQAKHAVRQIPSTSGGYTVHELTLSTGTLVRQYISSAGVVFAVTWSGPFKPDLRQLMGPHFETMIARQSKQSHANRRILSQHESDLVVESGGHPRSFSGRAYLPGALPAGVSDKDIQ